MEVINKNRHKAAELIWLISILLYTLTIFIKDSLIATTFLIPDRMIHGFILAGLFLLFVTEILEFRKERQYLIKSLTLLLLLVILFLLSERLIGVGDAMAFGYVFSARNFEWERTGLAVSILIIVMLIILFILSARGIIPDIVYSRTLPDRVRLRHSMGFAFCLQYSICFLNAIILLMSARNNKICYVTLSFLALAAIAVFSLADARLGYGASVAAIMGALVNKLFPGFAEKIKGFFWFLAFTPILYFVFSVVLAKKFDNTIPWMARLDAKLECRISLASAGLSNYGVSLFGKKVAWYGAGPDQGTFMAQSSGQYNWVDNLYIKDMIDFGIIYVIILLILITLAMIKCVRNKQYLNVFFIALIYGMGLIDDNIRLFCYNSMILLIGISFMKQREKLSDFDNV